MQQVQDYVSLTMYTSNVAVGGPGGNPFSLIATWPAVVKRITLYRDQQRPKFKGIYFERYDSSVLNVGGGFASADPSPLSYTFDEDERLTRILLYSSSSSNRFSGLELNTTKQVVKAFAYGYNASQCDMVEIPVGNGKWNGIFGKAGGDIDSFGIAMLTGAT